MTLNGAGSTLAAPIYQQWASTVKSQGLTINYNPVGSGAGQTALAAATVDFAGSDPALKATDMQPDQLMMGYKGIKFNEKGQNILASSLIIQLQDGENYVAVWPKANAAKTPALPYKGW